MLDKKNFEILGNQTNIRDILIIGRFSYEGDDNEIIMYGFADPEWEKNRRIFRYIKETEAVNIGYTNESKKNPDLIEPKYPVIKIANNFVVAGNGLQTTHICCISRKYGSHLHNPSKGVLSIFIKSLVQNYEYKDINGNLMQVNNFKPDRVLTPRIQGILYAPHVSSESAAALSYVKCAERCQSVKKTVSVPLEKNQNTARMIATFYDSGRILEVSDLNISGWEKHNYDATEFQKELSDLVFESLGDNAVGVASFLGYPKHEYIVNRIK